MIDEKFDKWFDMEMKFEGGYVNDPDDNGGMTYMGICRKNYPNLKIWNTLDEMKVNQRKKYKATEEEKKEIKEIYYKLYWKKVKADYYNNVNLSFQVADFAVNAGVSTSIKLLQRLMHITVDGIAGLQTVTTANNFNHILNVFIDERKKYYERISKKGNNIKFLKGWLRRVDNCHT